MYVKTINTVTKEKWGREIVNMYFKMELIFNRKLQL